MKLVGRSKVDGEAIQVTTLKNKFRPQQNVSSLQEQEFCSQKRKKPEVNSSTSDIPYIYLNDQELVESDSN